MSFQDPRPGRRSAGTAAAPGGSRPGRCLVLRAGLVFLGLPLVADSWDVAVRPPTAGQPAEVSLEPPVGTQWAVLFFRLEGEEGFQALTLAAREGRLQGTLPAFDRGGRLQYFLALRGAGEPTLLPAGAPEVLAGLDLPAAPATPPATVSPHRFPVQLEGSLEQVLGRFPSVPGERIRFATGQVRLGYQFEEDGQSFSLDARVSYLDNPPTGTSRWSLAELRSRYGHGGHTVQAGDLMVQESEFSIGGAARRGLDYSYQGAALTAHAFAVNSERLQGFRGMVWPEPGIRVYGGALGYSWFAGGLKSKLVLVAGSDDPSRAAGIGFLPFFRVREGTTAAWTLEANLPALGLNLAGEWARSRFDADTTGSSQPLLDDAWRLGGAWQARGFSVRAGYREVGRDFGSVGLPVLATDRHAFEGGLGYSAGAWSLNLNAQDERNNPDGNPLETRSRNAVRGLDLRYAFLPNASLRFGATRSEQISVGAVNALIPFASSTRKGGSMGLDWTFSALGMFSLNAQLERLRSLGAMDAAGRSETCSLALALTWPDRLRLAPNLSLSRTLDELTGLQTRNASAFLGATATFVPGLLSLVLNGGWNRLELSDGTVLATSSGDGALQWQIDRFLAKAFGRGACMLALRGRYLRRLDLPNSDRRVSITLNFAF